MSASAGHRVTSALNGGDAQALEQLVPKSSTTNLQRLARNGALSPRWPPAAFDFSAAGKYCLYKLLARKCCPDPLADQKD